MTRHDPNPDGTFEGMARPAQSSRREWLRRAGQVGLGSAALAAGCVAGEGAESANTNGSTPVPLAPPVAPAGEALLAPTLPGGALDDQWVFEKVTRCPDRHLRVHLRDAVHFGRLEIELFRGPTANRPLARTQHWELYSYDGGRGDRQTPDHVRSAVDLVALRVGENEERVGHHEESGALVALAASACTFDERTVGPAGDVPGRSREGPDPRSKPMGTASPVAGPAT
ncbi:MAG: hypothetical protein EXR79_00120 [Myxococcales bacterium]|nr:hypothetical protein [Myxococcales bacterium]